MWNSSPNYHTQAGLTGYPVAPAGQGSSGIDPTPRQHPPISPLAHSLAQMYRQACTAYPSVVGELQAEMLPATRFRRDAAHDATVMYTTSQGTVSYPLKTRHTSDMNRIEATAKAVAAELEANLPHATGYAGMPRTNRPAFLGQNRLPSLSPVQYIDAAQMSTCADEMARRPGCQGEDHQEILNQLRDAEQLAGLHLMAIFSSGKAAALLALEPEPGGNDVPFLRYLVTDPAYRGQARRLIDHAQSYSEDMEKNGYLDTKPHNATAADRLASLGFRPRCTDELSQPADGVTQDEELGERYYMHRPPAYRDQA